MMAHIRWGMKDLKPALKDIQQTTIMMMTEIRAIFRAVGTSPSSGFARNSPVAGVMVEMAIIDVQTRFMQDQDLTRITLI